MCPSNQLQNRCLPRVNAKTGTPKREATDENIKRAPDDNTTDADDSGTRCSAACASRIFRTDGRADASARRGACHGRGWSASARPAASYVPMDRRDKSSSSFAMVYCDEIITSARDGSSTKRSRGTARGEITTACAMDRSWSRVETYVRGGVALAGRKNKRENVSGRVDFISVFFFFALLAHCSLFAHKQKQMTTVLSDAQRGALSSTVEKA